MFSKASALFAVGFLGLLGLLGPTVSWSSYVDTISEGGDQYDVDIRFGLIGYYLRVRNHNDKNWLQSSESYSENDSCDLGTGGNDPGKACTNCKDAGFAVVAFTYLGAAGAFIGATAAMQAGPKMKITERVGSGTAFVCFLLAWAIWAGGCQDALKDNFKYAGKTRDVQVSWAWFFALGADLVLAAVYLLEWCFGFFGGNDGGGGGYMYTRT